MPPKGYKKRYLQQLDAPDTNKVREALSPEARSMVDGFGDAILAGKEKHNRTAIATEGKDQIKHFGPDMARELFMRLAVFLDDQGLDPTEVITRRIAGE